MRARAEQVWQAALEAVMPDRAVYKALEGMKFPGRVYVVAAGKAAWQMAQAAQKCLKDAITAGLVITKYHHVMGEIPGFTCYEAGHPVPDENSFSATAAALALTEELTPTDTVLFLLSGGGSALFELPRVSGEELADITRQLLACGADIVEVNTIRKRLSRVKGGQFARHCAPAAVHSIILSDVLGDAVDIIASGPACPDATHSREALAVVEKYGLRLSERALSCLREETPKELENATWEVTGSVRELCRAAAEACQKLGYTPYILTDGLCCQAREAGAFLGAVAASHAHEGRKMAFIAGGETVVKVIGKGKGGRNQELALGAAQSIAGLEGVCLFSIGSDGTDGPTDAAGGFVDGSTYGKLAAMGLSVYQILENNDAYHGLAAVDGLIITGPTGTNVNDVAVALVEGT